MAIPVIESTSVSNNSGGATSASIDKPSGTAEGDLLLLHGFVYFDNQTTLTIPSGFTLLWKHDRDQYFGCTYCCYKISGDSEPGSYGISWTTSRANTHRMLRISGVDATTPINESSVVGDSFSPMVCPDITTTVDDCLIIRNIATSASDPTSITPPDGLTLVYDDANGFATAHRLRSDTEEQATAGAVGTASYTRSGSGVAGTVATIAIAPPGGGGGAEVVPSRENTWVAKARPTTWTANERPTTWSANERPTTWSANAR